MNRPFTTPQIRPLAISSAPSQAGVGDAVASVLRMAAKHRELIAVVAFSAIGLIITLVGISQMSDFSDAIAEISLVP